MNDNNKEIEGSFEKINMTVAHLVPMVILMMYILMKY